MCESSTKVCPECHSHNTFPEACCGNMGCAECGAGFHRDDMKCPGEIIDAAEIMRGDER